MEIKGWAGEMPSPHMHNFLASLSPHPPPPPRSASDDLGQVSPLRPIIEARMIKVWRCLCHRKPCSSVSRVNFLDANPHILL